MNEREPEGPLPPDPRRKALLGLLFVMLLIVGGLLLTSVLRHMAQLQDCTLSGRTDCVPIDPATTPNR
jgi:hypothetical protein